MPRRCAKIALRKPEKSPRLSQKRPTNSRLRCRIAQALSQRDAAETLSRQVQEEKEHLLEELQALKARALQVPQKSPTNEP